MAKKSLTLFDRIKAKLNLGDDGKVNNFISKLETDFKRQIKAIDHNINGLTLNHDNELEGLDDQLQSAQEAIHDAWENITPEDVVNNAAQESFKKTFLDRIKAAEDHLVSLEKKREKAIEDHVKKLHELQDQKAKYQDYLSVL